MVALAVGHVHTALLCLCTCMSNHKVREVHLFQQGEGSVLRSKMVLSTRATHTKWTLGIKCTRLRYQLPSVSALFYVVVVIVG